MGDDGGSKKVNTQVQKQKDALAKARSVVQRPSAPNTPPQSQNVINSNLPRFITYPEFAPARQHSSDRVVSLGRLLLVLYLSAGTTATMYIVSKVYSRRRWISTENVVVLPTIGAEVSTVQKRLLSTCLSESRPSYRASLRYALSLPSYFLEVLITSRTLYHSQT